MRIHLGIEEHRVDVTSPHAAPLAWLVEFLAPAFHQAGAGDGSAALRVDFRIDRDRHTKLSRAMASASLRSLDGFTRDGSFSRNPAWRAEDGGTWAHEEDGDAYVGVTEGGRAVTVVVREDEARPRVALMRVVRELATIALLRSGRIPLHAAAFVLEGRGVLVCGARRAGKTSLLVHALRCGAGFLSNDRIFASAGETPLARAMPTIVQLRHGTLALFEGLARDFEAAAFDRGRTLAECAPGMPRPRPTPGAGQDRPGISPAQLCRLLGAPMQGAAPLGAILFPRIDEAVGGVALEPLDPERAGGLLLRNLLVPSSPARHSGLFAPAAADRVIPPERLARDCRRLAACVPAFACRLGPGSVATDLRAALLPIVGTQEPGTDTRLSKGRRSVRGRSAVSRQPQ